MDVRVYYFRSLNLLINITCECGCNCSSIFHHSANYSDNKWREFKPICSKNRDNNTNPSWFDNFISYLNTEYEYDGVPYISIKMINYKWYFYCLEFSEILDQFFISVNVEELIKEPCLD